MKTFSGWLKVLVATVWIACFEFLRNELLFKSYWVEHYAKMNLTFPDSATNGLIWGIWSLCFAIVIYYIGKAYKVWPTFAIAWIAGYVLMWLVIGNLNVLPNDLLVYAVPLSMVEAFVATLIVKLPLKRADFKQGKNNKRTHKKRS